MTATAVFVLPQPCQCSLFPSVVPDAPVTNTPTEQAERSRYVAELRAEVARLSLRVVILTTAVETVISSRPCRYGTTGEHACRRWPLCTHPGCEALREGQDVLRIAHEESRAVQIGGPCDP